MSLSRPLRSFRSVLSPSRLATSSRVTIHDATSARYAAVHIFSTRQASTLAQRQRTVGYSPTIRLSTLRIRYNSTTPPARPCPDCPAVEKRGHAQEYTPFIQRLIHRTHQISPDSPHRPTKEELLSAARSRWERFRIRLQWFFIRGWRRFNTDDLSAFASWFVVGNTLWIVIGTTTFVSAVFATLNSLSLQKYVARWISDYLTSETGVNVV